MVTGRVLPLAVVTLAVAAVLVDLSDIHLLANADTIVPSIMVLQRWTPFYWDQERYGMLVPLVATPLANPLHVFLAIDGICAFLGLLTPVLLGFWLLRDRGAIAGLSSSALLLLAMPERLRAEYLNAAQPYATSMALAALAMILLDHRRWRTLAFLVLCLACWVNVATPLWLFPLLLVEKRRAWGDWLVVVGAAAVGAVLMLGAEYRGTSRALVDVSEWAWSLGRLFGRFFALPVGVLLGVPVVMALVGLVLRPSREVLRKVLALVVGAVVCGLVMGVQLWVYLNLYAPRYLLPCVILVVTAGMLLGVTTLLARADAVRMHAVTVGLCCVLVGAAPVVLGPPSLERVRSDIALLGGAEAEEAIALRCTHLLGEYWRVWPAIFVAQWRLHEQGTPRRIYGLADRGIVMRDEWMALPPAQWRVCLVLGGQLSEHVTSRLAVPELSPTGERGSVLLVLGRTPPAGP